MVDITPQQDFPSYNNVLLGSDPDASRLLCQAVVFDDGETRGAIISIDSTFVDRALVLTIRDACKRATGIPGQNILVAATHTHAAPASCVSFLAGARPDPTYVDALVEGAVEAVVTANGDLCSSFIKAINCFAPGFEKNRRLLRPNGLVVMSGANNSDDAFLPAGPVDPVMPILAFTDPGGYPLAIVINYAIHNNCVGGSYSADLAGRIGDALREKYGPQLVTPFLEAPCADVIWDGPEGGPTRGDDLAKLIGASVAEGVAVALGETDPVGPESVRMMVSVDNYHDRLFEDSTFCRDDCRGDTPEMLEAQRRRYDPEEAAVEVRGETTCPVELMGISFGETAIVTNPAELFVVYGIAIKERSPFEVTLVSELTNGYCGYVGTQKAFCEQGYEVHRTVYTCRLAKDSGDRITEASVQMLEDLRGGDWQLPEGLE
jgi:hypothetical protein